MPIMIGYEEYWNKKIGTNVLKELLYLAEKNNFKKINVTIYKYNIRSQRLYTSLGFKLVSEDEEKIFYEWTRENK